MITAVESREAEAERRLRGCVRDLVALSTISAWWIGRPPSAIAESLRDLLASMLRADAVRVQLRNPETGETTNAVTGSLPGEGRAGRFASFPIGIDGQMGRLAVGWQRAEVPSELESMLLTVAANHAAVALEQSILLARHERAEHRLAALAAHQSAVAHLEMRALVGIPFDQMLDESAEIVTDTLGVDCSEILALTPDCRSLLLKAGRGWAPGLVGRALVTADVGGLAGYTLSVREAVVVPDLRRDVRFHATPHLRDRKVVSGVSVVIRDQARPFGLLAVYAQALRIFSAGDVQFLRSISNLLAATLQVHRAVAEREVQLTETRRAVASRDLAVGVVSHDLGNPLSTIQICANALLDPTPPSPEGVRDMALLIRRSAGWMQQMAHDLLDRASLDSGRLTLERRPTRVSDLLGSVREMFSHVAAAEALIFRVEDAAGPHAIDADPRRLLQVLSNLVNNAMKFTRPGGEVVLSARPDSGHPLPARVRFTVQDTGPGITPAELPHIFDWFWRSQPEGRGGTGLGLGIAKGLVEAHGAALNVESALGRGSTFWFSIPVAIGLAG